MEGGAGAIQEKHTLYIDANWMTKLDVCKFNSDWTETTDGAGEFNAASTERQCVLECKFNKTQKQNS